MKKIILIIITSSFLIACSKGGSTDISEPLCEEGGTEVQMD
tara:strand:+ start:204 stop:326 length:123 start_codon:yes stop_codon:yes gene_type:complete